MIKPDSIIYHEGLTELLQMKRLMLRTVGRYCVIGLTAAIVLAIIALFFSSSLWFSLSSAIPTPLN